MILGRVVGEVWATRRHPGLSGRKLLIIQPHLWYDPPYEVAHLVAVDPVGAGVGEDVLVCIGDPGRRVVAGVAGDGTATAPLLPVDATVMAIVDRVALDRSSERPGGAYGRPLRVLGPAPEWAAEGADR